ncbi:MAG TPA: hypothetical protein VFX65_13405 [Candidatus Limnocylindrales bacterium]|nr:hypothetical protein [Candidatus Limnocylindrales bacterium]
MTGWEMIEPAAQADPRVVEAEATALLEAFLAARIAGDGADELVAFSVDVASALVDPEVPLLYAASTGAPYERTEFELVEGPVWPEGWMRFVVRLFAENGETTVEQRVSLDWDDGDRLRLVYDFAEWYGDGPGTTENGEAVPVRYEFLDGEVTYRAAYPLGPSRAENRDPDQLAIDRLEPDRTTNRILALLADPRPIGPDCLAVPAPASADALARIIGSNPNYEATAPVAVTIGGRSALQMEVLRAPVSSCGLLLEPTFFGISDRFASNDRARLYLLDLPGGSARILVIAISADGDDFETVLEWAAPILDSIEFHAP